MGGGDAEVPSLGWDRFIGLFGGPVLSLKPFNLAFGSICTNWVTTGSRKEYGANRTTSLRPT